MGSLKINAYTAVTFENRRPVGISWEIAEMAEVPNNSELIDEAVGMLGKCGWRVTISNVRWANKEPCSPLIASIYCQ